MEISSMNSAMQQVAQSTQAINQVLKNAAETDQELSGKLIKMSVDSRVSGEAFESKVDFQA